eukprot:5799046-Amphidinium_carterae.1
MKQLWFRAFTAQEDCHSDNVVEPGRSRCLIMIKHTTLGRAEARLAMKEALLAAHRNDGPYLPACSVETNCTTVLAPVGL